MRLIFIFILLFFVSCNFVEKADNYFISGDKWADSLTIPNNITLNYPTNLDFDYGRPDSVLSLKKTEPDFLLYNSFQPGLYEYDFWYGKIEKGTIYIKAYEVTQAYALTTHRLPETTAIKVENTSDSIEKYSTKHDFTIYEGDWGKPYAARFEIWFKPFKGDKERKLFEKNYVIEGWMH